MQFKAVVFDMGGVIKSYPKTNFIEKFIEFVKNDSTLVQVWSDLKNGVLTLSDMCSMTKELSDNFPELARATSDADESPVSVLPDDPNFAVAVPKIKSAGFQIALLTNNWFLDKGKTKSLVIQNASSVYDTVVESCRVGCRKPEIQIYQLVANRLGVKPEECIMVDDLLRNCEGAEKAGMTAVQVKDMDSKSAVGELERLLDMKIL